MGRKLLQIIVNECSQTLSELTISNTYGMTLRPIFPKIQTLNYRVIDGCAIYPSWFQITQWFPKLRKLSFDDDFGSGTLTTDIVHFIPHLEEFCFDGQAKKWIVFFQLLILSTPI